MKEKSPVAAIGLTLAGAIGTLLLVLQISRTASAVEAMRGRVDNLRSRGGAGEAGESESELSPSESAALRQTIDQLKAQILAARDEGEGTVLITDENGRPISNRQDLAALAASAYRDWRVADQKKWADRQIDKERINAKRVIETNLNPRLALSDDQQKKVLDALNGQLDECVPILRLENIPDDISAWSVKKQGEFSRKMEEILTPEQYKTYIRHPVNIIGGMVFDSRIRRAKDK